jgi:hypothetical protein
MGVDTMLMRKPGEGGQAYRADPDDRRLAAFRPGDVRRVSVARMR